LWQSADRLFSSMRIKRFARSEADLDGDWATLVLEPA
jgi:hypothetical protein